MKGLIAEINTPNIRITKPLNDTLQIIFIMTK